LGSDHGFGETSRKQWRHWPGEEKYAVSRVLGCENLWSILFNQKRINIKSHWKKKSLKTVKIESRNVVETDTMSLCLLKKPTYRQHFRGRRSFNYAKRFSVFNQEIWQCNPHSNLPLSALRPPFYLASSLHPPHKPSPQLLIGRGPSRWHIKSMKKLWDLFSNRIENCGICFQIA
jgi:hypothetical protein